MWHFICSFLFPFNVSCVFTFSFPPFFSLSFKYCPIVWNGGKKIKLMAHNDYWIVKLNTKGGKEILYSFINHHHMQNRDYRKFLIWLYVAYLCNIFFSVLKFSITIFFFPKNHCFQLNCFIRLILIFSNPSIPSYRFFFLFFF